MENKEIDLAAAEQAIERRKKAIEQQMNMITGHVLVAIGAGTLKQTLYEIITKETQAAREDGYKRGFEAGKTAESAADDSTDEPQMKVSRDEQSKKRGKNK